MIVAGIVLLILGALLLLAGLFGASGFDIALDLGALSISMNATTLFLLGVIATALVFVGLGLVKGGTRRGLRHRKERKEAMELNKRLDEARADSQSDDDPDRYPEKN